MFTLTTMHRDKDEYNSALKYAKNLNELLPDDPTISQLVNQLNKLVLNPN